MAIDNIARALALRGGKGSGEDSKDYNIIKEIKEDGTIVYHLQANGTNVGEPIEVTKCEDNGFADSEDVDNIFTPIAETANNKDIDNIFGDNP